MLRFLLEKEFKQIFRNPFLLKLLVIMPLMVIVVFPYVTNQEVRNVKLSIVDNDHSPASNRLIQKAASSSCFQLTDVSSTYDEALRNLELGESDIILEIPRNFERDLKRNEKAKVMISANSVNGTQGGLGSQYLSFIVTDYGNEFREQENPVNLSAADIPIFQTDMIYRFNPSLDYKVFMIPGLIVVLVTLLCCALTALNIVGEKESGTIEQINVTPVPKSLFIIAKLMPNWIIGFLALAFGMIFAWLIHGLVPEGNLFTVFVFSALYILAMSGMGMVISNYSNTMQQAMFIMFFFLIIMMLTCGLFTPLNSMPEWMQIITKVNPVLYFVEVIRLIYLKGSTLNELLPNLLWLCGFTIVFNVWAVISYKKSA